MATDLLEAALLLEMTLSEDEFERRVEEGRVTMADMLLEEQAKSRRPKRSAADAD